MCRGWSEHRSEERREQRRVRDLLAQEEERPEPPQWVADDAPAREREPAPVVERVPVTAGS